MDTLKRGSDPSLLLGNLEWKRYIYINFFFLEGAGGGGVVWAGGWSSSDL